MLSLTWLAVTISGALYLPPGWHPAPQSLGVAGDAGLAALIVFLVHALMLAPVEYAGGAVLVRERPGVGRWIRDWLRGVTVQGVLFALVATGMAAGATIIGAFGPTLAAIVAATMLALLQGPLAGLVAALPRRRANEHVRAFAVSSGVRPECIRVVDARDEAFVGGWIGLGRPELWIPARWTSPDESSLLAVQLARRHDQWTSGARRRGMLRAILWNVFGVMLLAPLLPWPLADARTFLVLPAVSTLWSFLSVLLLPGPSRTSVYNADREAADRLGVTVVSEAILRLDGWQDDEAERSLGVEFFFHPVPSRGNRLRALTARRRIVLGGGHQLTRLTLFTSLASLGLLGRMVHCNIGRPTLWVVYPGD